jgi:hypothetical protein
MLGLGLPDIESPRMRPGSRASAIVCPRPCQLLATAAGHIAHPLFDVLSVDMGVANWATLHVSSHEASTGEGADGRPNW